MKLYVYIPNVDVPSVERYGLLGARELYERTGRLPVQKYATQLAQATRRYPALQKLVANMTPEQATLKYLDWRIDQPNGSNAIYALYRPVPKSAHALMRDFLCDRTLFEIIVDCDVYPVGAPIKDAWRKEIARADPHRLWFENIPHCYFLCKPKRIKKMLKSI